MEIGSFVALGDSFTEGMDDPRADQSGYRGWADRFAEKISAGRPGLRYANLAVRGKLLRQVAEEQVPAAIAMAPDLVSIAAGGNDMLRLRTDPDALAQSFDEVVRTLLMAGCRVLMFTGFDPRFPVLRLIRGKVAAFNMHLRAIAEHHQCHVVDLWAMNVLRDPRAWSADRLHLTPDAHRRVALRACEVMGVPVTEDWRDPWPAAQGLASTGTKAWLAARWMDARWARVHAAPWVARRLRGESSGDGIDPKRPELLQL
jgi:lysophospholipase L1-like esterase